MAPSSKAEVYCICRRPDMGLWMVGCDFCDDWFHGKCVGVAEEDGELIESYCCPNCAKKSLGQTSWKRKCLLPSCRKPALFDKTNKSSAQRSKYCSPEHGVEWFKLNIDVHTRGSSSSKSSPSTTDDGYRNQPISPAELAAVVKSAGSLSRFKLLGEFIQLPDPPSSVSASAPASSASSPAPTPKPLSSLFLSSSTTSAPLDEERGLYLAEERRVLSNLAAERREINQALQYIENKAAYIDFIKLRASAQKTICGFDRKLVWDDAEWQAWCDSQEGQRALREISQFKIRQEETRARMMAELEEQEKREAAEAAAAAAEAAAARSAAGNSRKPKRAAPQRKRKQQVQVPIDLQEIVGILGEGASEDEVCMLEKRRCSRHANWQYIRAEEVELDERVARNALAKIEAGEQAIARRATARRYKDSTKDGGRCITVS
ncbi:hypothetical protein BZA70DRAFT_279378 [Myxozyma melibiosi]|uniref:PHD-type domain-containing protein n=1 Tax=Myxozyma melibiosi TaxID=54550 RepID=A0ABR1F5X1_9ASCO